MPLPMGRRISFCSSPWASSDQISFRSWSTRKRLPRSAPVFSRAILRMRPSSSGRSRVEFRILLASTRNCSRASWRACWASASRASARVAGAGAAVATAVEVSLMFSFIADDEQSHIIPGRGSYSEFSDVAEDGVGQLFGGVGAEALHRLHQPLQPVELARGIGGIEKAVGVKHQGRSEEHT